MDLQYTKDQYGFWKQENPKPFKYNKTYNRKQSMTKQMAWMRLGFIAASLRGFDLGAMKVLDYGSGNKVFGKAVGSKFGEFHEYDVVDSELTKEEVYDQRWDLVVMADVIEHMYDINQVLKLRTKFLYLTFPETPIVNDWKELKDWRHFKPDEHIYMLNQVGVFGWLFDNGWRTVSKSNYEDLIRTGENPSLNNTSTIIAYNERAFSTKKSS